MAQELSLEELRKETTRITLNIIRLCGERILLAKKIGEIKAQRNLPIESRKVEEDLRSKSIEVCKDYGMDKNFCLKLLELLLDESKRVQNEIVKLKT